MILSVLLSIAIPVSIIAVAILLLRRNVPTFTEYQKDLIRTVGEEIRKTKETNGDISNQDISTIIKKHNLKEQDLINYILKKYGKIEMTTDERKIDE